MFVHSWQPYDEEQYGEAGEEYPEGGENEEQGRHYREEVADVEGEEGGERGGERGTARIAKVKNVLYSLS